MLEDGALAAWLADRAGCVTGSRMPDVLDFRKDGKPGAARVQYAKDILAERLTGESVRHYVNPAMQHGLDYEAEAKSLFEAESGLLVMPCGFVHHPSIEYFGSTPDGLIERDAVLEVKCPTTATFMDWIIAGVVPEQHKPQMISQIACTGRRRAHFVAYDPRLKDRRLRLFIREFVPTVAEIAAIEKAAADFLAEIDAMWERFHQAAA